TLEECIQLALEHNLDLRIERIMPRIAKLSLENAYSAYDPSLTTSFGHTSSSSPSGVDPQGRSYPPTETRKDSASVGISGLGPLGQNYRFSASFNDTYGVRPGSALDWSNPFYVTNYFEFVDPPWGSASVRTLQPGTITVSNPFQTADGYVGFTITQPLLRNFWIDSPRLNIILRRKDLKASEQDYRRAVIATVSSVQQAYYSLIAAREAVKVREMALELSEELLRENRKRIEVGVLAPLDEKQAESEVAASRAALLGALNDVRTAQNALKKLITDNWDEWKEYDLEPAEKLTTVAQVFNRQDSWAKGLTMRPELIKARIELEKQNVTLKYDRNQLYPQLDLVGSFGLAGSGNEFSDEFGVIGDRSNPTYGFGFQFSMPLSRRAARTAYRMTKENIEQALLAIKKLEQDILVEIDNAIAQAQTSLQQVEATRASRQYAEAALEAEKKKLESGKSTNFEVIRLQRDLTQRRYEELAALVQYNTALVRLAQAEGSTLEQHGITLEIK
ncbi:MAG: TolC family protein, partial [Verrucomicrobiae bacterium]|nr:TolC family protein [Verrucomicrobiae bacterium]